MCLRLVTPKGQNHAIVPTFYELNSFAEAEGWMVRLIGNNELESTMKNTLLFHYKTPKPGCRMSHCGRFEIEKDDGIHGSNYIAADLRLGCCYIYKDGFYTFKEAQTWCLNRLDMTICHFDGDDVCVSSNQLWYQQVETSLWYGLYVLMGFNPIGQTAMNLLDFSYNPKQDQESGHIYFVNPWS